MNERAEFLRWFDTEWRDAEVALHNGDADPRRRLWSTKDPVTVFGAWKTATTSADVDALFDSLAVAFSDGTAADVELVSADAVGDFAYTVAYEHTTASWNGQPRTYTLRVTQLYRKENATWKVFHRHGDELAPG